MSPEQRVEVAERYMQKLDAIIGRYVEPENAFYQSSLEAVERLTIDLSAQELRELLAAALRVTRPLGQI